MTAAVQQPAPAEPPAPAPAAPDPRGARLAKLAFAAIGVVYGDIGTSPLYALRECFGEHGVRATEENVYGVLSLVFWALLMVVSVKYLVYMMRADNEGEGGILALLALVRPRGARHGRPGAALVLLGLFGAGLLYGDAIITPAISVLSAVEGLEVVGTGFAPVVVPIAIAILVGLFVVQRWGSGRLGALFGIVMLGWFASIAAAGAPWIARAPRVLWAVSPHHALRFFLENGVHGFTLLGAVVLVVTGGEALYADMGHFGRRAIRLAWYAIVYPALLVSYFGQGAFLLVHPEGVANPFYALVPREHLYPMIALATVATVIASQALISGAFSLSRQALQLGYLPRLTLMHTSGRERGQIYVPEVNELMMVACIAVVIGFGSSAALAAAYGAAVSGTMTITSILFYAAMRHRLGERTAQRLLATFLVFDLAFLSANVLKVAHGGWLPLAVGALLFVIMTTWRRGRELLASRLAREATPRPVRVERRRGAPPPPRLARAATPLPVLVERLREAPPLRIPGAAVFLTASPGVAPPVLLHHLRHNKVLHERALLLTISSERVPEVPEAGRVEVEELGGGLARATAHFGFMQTPSVPAVIAACRKKGLALPEAETTFYLGRESLLTSGKSRLAAWRRRLFAFLARNSRAPSYYFGIPPDRVVEIGMQIQI